MRIEITLEDTVKGLRTSCRVFRTGVLDHGSVSLALLLAMQLQERIESSIKGKYLVVNKDEPPSLGQQTYDNNPNN